jgi:hypothetical protein
LCLQIVQITFSFDDNKELQPAQTAGKNRFIMCLNI